MSDKSSPPITYKSGVLKHAPESSNFTPNSNLETAPTRYRRHLSTMAATSSTTALRAPFGSICLPPIVRFGPLQQSKALRCSYPKQRHGLATSTVIDHTDALGTRICAQRALRQPYRHPKPPPRTRRWPATQPKAPKAQLIASRVSNIRTWSSSTALQYSTSSSNNGYVTTPIPPVISS